MAESKIEVRIIDETSGLGVTPPDNRLNVLGMVISPSGRTDLHRVNSTVEFSREFFAGKQITSNSHKTARYVRGLLNTSPIWVKRVARNNLLAGIGSSTREAVYTDNTQNIINGLIRDIIPTVEYKTITDYMNKDENKTIPYINNPKYFTSSNDFNLPTDYYSKKNTLNLKTSIVFDTTDQSQELSGSIDIVIGGSSKTINRGKLSQVAKDIYDACVSFTMEPDHISGSSVYADNHKLIFRTVSETIPNPNFDPSIPEDPNTNPSTIPNPNYPATINSFDFTIPNAIAINYTDESHDYNLVKVESISSTYQYYNTYSESERMDHVNMGTNWYLAFGSENTETLYIFRGKDVTKEEVPYDTAKYTTIIQEQINETDYRSIMEQIVRLGSGYFNLDTSSESVFLLPGISEVISSTEFTVSGTEVINDTVSIDKFAILSKFPNSTPVFNYNLSIVNEDLETYKLVISYANIDEEWVFSFIDGATDGNGVDLFYTRVGENSKIITIVPLLGSKVTASSGQFGNQLTNNWITDDYVAPALIDLIENKESPVYMDYVLDGGIAGNSALISAIKTAHNEFFSFYPASCSETSSVMRDKDLRSLIGDDPYARYIAGNMRDAGQLDSGVTTFPASFYYMRRRLELGNSAQEFIPMYGSNGYIKMTPIVKYTTDQREELLNSQITSLVRDTVTGEYYLNDNLTCKTTDSYLQSDGIVLMVNKISQITSGYARTLIGQYNTYQLRNAVTTYLTKTIKDRLRVGTQNGPVKITVACDNDNNPQESINQRKLIIDIYATFNRDIKDVLIYQHVQSL